MPQPQYFVEMKNLAEWRAHLGDPDRHWKRGYSAMELAIAWTNARTSPRGMPAGVATMLNRVPDLAGAALTLAIPGLRSALPDGSAPSPVDLWGLLSGTSGLISLIVESKAQESFGSLVREFHMDDGLRADPCPGPPTHLEQLCSVLGLTRQTLQSLHYTLVHHAVAALMEAERWRAPTAMLLVQRFTGDPGGKPADSWPDFGRFARALGTAATRGYPEKANVPGPIALYLGWLDAGLATEAEAAAAGGSLRAAA